MKGLRWIWLAGVLLVIAGISCTKSNVDTGPYFGNGFHNGWADQHSIVIWTRLTKNPDMNYNGEPFISLTRDQQRLLSRMAGQDTMHNAQIPKGLTLDDMEGACPGAPGQVKMVYKPYGSSEIVESDWVAVDTSKNYTHQWQLDDLNANTLYDITLYARKNASSAISDTIRGTFKTPPATETIQDITFTIVTCHDYIRRDDPKNGHKIYPAMLRNRPDFYVHTGDIEYYDKPDPWAMTEPLMRFKWDRLFALPYQRDFYRQITTYFIKDDHDALKNDCWAGQTYGTVTFERGLEIFEKEQFPTNDSLYKTIRWGKDLQIWIMEGRHFRSSNQMPDGPEKTIWGEEQKQWLFKTMRASDATYKLLISATPILGPDRENKNDNYANKGFEYEGDEIRDFINSQKNVFICNGDRHWQYVTHWDNTNLWEFSTGAGSDIHAGGWKQEDLMPEHRFLRVKGGYLLGKVYREKGLIKLIFEHHDVDGNLVHTERFETKI